MITIGLIGNPNTGKTSLFNSLTGKNQHVGNWAGKTVEKKTGRIKHKNIDILVVDLPGVYSLNSYSEEEKISRNFIKNQNPDLIVQVVDLNSLLRNLLMTLELLAQGKKVILALNFYNQARKSGIITNISELKKKLQIPAVPIEANSGKGKIQLLDKIINVASASYCNPKYLKTLIKKDNTIDHKKSIFYLEKFLKDCYSLGIIPKKTKKIDDLILNKYTAFPFFLATIVFIFQVSFKLSTPLISLINNFFNFINGYIISFKLNFLLNSFLTNTVIGGLGLVLSFTPMLFILFLLMAILEDTGYFSRMVFLMDKIFEKIGLSGRSFLPMILGLGCNVPAILSTRTIKNRRERLIAIFITPFISCSARLPIYMLFTNIFFPNKRLLIITSLYLFGMLTAFLESIILSKIIKQRGNDSLAIELPPYRMPKLTNIIRYSWSQTKMFILKAGTIIFRINILLWILISLPWIFNQNINPLELIGNFLAPVFAPLGFGNWRFVSALIFGFTAKEVIISSLATFYKSSGQNLFVLIQKDITPMAALSFLFFVLLYFPCLATFSAIKREVGKWKFLLLQVGTNLLAAWFVAFLVYRTGLLLGFK